MKYVQIGNEIGFEISRTSFTDGHRDFAQVQLNERYSKIVFLDSVIELTREQVIDSIGRAFVNIILKADFLGITNDELAQILNGAIDASQNKSL